MSAPHKYKRKSCFPIFCVIAAVGLVYLTYPYFQKRSNSAPIQNFGQSEFYHGPLEPSRGFPSGKNSQKSVAPPSSAPPSFKLIEDEKPIDNFPTIDDEKSIDDVASIEEKSINFELTDEKSIDNRKKAAKKEKLENVETTSPNPCLLDYVGYRQKDKQEYQHPPMYTINFDTKISTPKSYSNPDLNEIPSQSTKKFGGVVIIPSSSEGTEIKPDESSAQNFHAENSIDDILDCPGQIRTVREFCIQIWLKLSQIWFKFLQYFTYTSYDLTKCCHALLDDRPVWFWVTVCSMAVMLTGVVPAFLIPEQGALKCGQKRAPSISPIQLNRLLCFAVGSLLGDVFFHLLPESWNNANLEANFHVGLWVLAGLLTCLVIEKFCAQSESGQHYVAAMANLVANIMDNFTHGLAVGGSFLVSKRLGFITTFAILIHEIPHEISDFAILLRADFDRKSAIKAQLITAFGGITGAAVALITDHSSASKANQGSCWILPFTAGGFLNIALIQVLPDLMKERRAGETIIQLLLISVGICTMGLLNASIHV